MRIAQVAPLWEPVPPKGYGGIELVVALLTDELVARGHDVTLFASGDLNTKAKLETVVPKALCHAPSSSNPVVSEMLPTGHLYNGIDTDSYPFYPKARTEVPYLAFLGRMSPQKDPHLVTEVTRRSGWKLIMGGSEMLPTEHLLDLVDQFDLIPCHTWISPFPLAKLLKMPMASTLHGNFTAQHVALYRTIWRSSNVACRKYLKVTGPSAQALRYISIQFKVFQEKTVKKVKLIMQTLPRLPPLKTCQCASVS